MKKSLIILLSLGIISLITNVCMDNDYEVASFRYTEGMKSKTRNISDSGFIYDSISRYNCNNSLTDKEYNPNENNIMTNCDCFFNTLTAIKTILRINS